MGNQEGIWPLTGAPFKFAIGNRRMGWDSNPRYAYTHGGFQDRCLKPLGHPSRIAVNKTSRPPRQALTRE